MLDLRTRWARWTQTQFGWQWVRITTADGRSYVRRVRRIGQRLYVRNWGSWPRYRELLIGGRVYGVAASWETVAGCVYGREAGDV